MARRKIIGTEEFNIEEVQDDRLWIHSKKRNWGIWVYNSDIEKIFEENEDKNNRDSLSQK